MFKKISVIILVVAICASFASCVTSYAPTVTESMVDAGNTVSIQDYLGKANTYFSLYNHKSAKNEITATGEDAFNEFLKSCTSNEDLPDELVKSYADKFVQTEESAISQADAEKSAKELIKAELVTYAAYNSIAKDNGYATQLTHAMRKAAEKDFGGEGYEVKEGLSEASYYLIDTFIKQKVIIAYLSEEEIPYGVGSADKAETSK